MNDFKSIMYVVVFCFLVSVLLVVGCDARFSKMTTMGSECKVELLDCSGNVVRAWTSTGKVLSEETSDGYYFKDKETGKLVEVTGTIVITSL